MRVHAKCQPLFHVTSSSSINPNLGHCWTGGGGIITGHALGTGDVYNNMAQLQVDINIDKDKDEMYDQYVQVIRDENDQFNAQHQNY